jgi:hypothetical protein
LQTFLPLANFYETAKVLDYRRLGKMRVESLQLVNIIEGRTKSNAWKNHPAVGLWRDYVTALKIYCNTMIEEWIRRGYKNTMKLYDIPIDASVTFPRWFGRDDFHSRHRAALLAKDYEWYKQFGWKEEPKFDYVWR